MKNAKFLLFGAGSLLLLAQGCEEKKSEFKPLSGGFGVQAQWIGIDSGPRAELYYRTNNSKPVLIWPFLDGDTFYTNDLFFFVGSIRDEEGRIRIPRYFVVKAPGPAIDVSDDLLRRLADSNHLDFAEAKRYYKPLKLQKLPESEQIQVHFFGPDHGPNDLMVNWDQLLEIIQDVKGAAKQYSVEDPHVVYLKKDY